MRPLAVAITLLTVAAQPAATQDRYRVAWWDAASVLVAGGLSVIPQTAGLPRGAPPCAPCDPASLPGIDHVALHTFSASAGTARRCAAPRDRCRAARRGRTEIGRAHV